jgi:GT2 family glycosyltransferase
MSVRIVMPDGPQEPGADRSAALAAAIRRQLGPSPKPSPQPSPVSIVVVNRNGAEHLRRLVSGLVKHTDYRWIELIVVDNGSEDGSLDFIRRVPTPFPVTIVANHHNESFSDANNQGAALASGELLLFANNDIQPFEAGWLRELVASLRRGQAGIAGATLIFPKADSQSGYLVQHRDMRLAEAEEFPLADLNGHGEDVFAAGFGEDADSVIPTGACMLIDARLFREIDGFTHGYFFGGEDLDLGLKALDRGRRILCSGRSILIHHIGSTRRGPTAGQPWATRWRNMELLWKRWGPRLRREYELDRLQGGGRWASEAAGTPATPPEQILALSFCLKLGGPAAGGEREGLMNRLRTELRNRGHRCELLTGEEADRLAAFGYDVAVHVREARRHIPRPSQLNVLLTLDETPLAAIERSRFDLVLEAGDTPPSALVEAILARAAELQHPTRIPAAQSHGDSPACVS